MSDNELHIYRNIIGGMSEGVLSITMTGKITTVNQAALNILGIKESDAIGKAFAALFFGYSENDAFNQTVLDAIYENSTSHNSTVDYFDGILLKKLFVSTSFIWNGDEKVGVVAVFNDITQLVSLQNAVLAMEQIKSLNSELEKRNKFIKKTFGRYLSDDIVNTILEEKDGLSIGGKKQCVTIMFTDIRGFTAISEAMHPYDLIEMLNHYLGEMITIIQARKGTILEFIGDAIVVVFGAPLESESRDFDAVCCAVEMQRQMETVNEFNRSKGYPDIEMGIGIHTGEAVLGNIGSEQKTKYDIIGKNVNLASRIETYTVGGQILISDETRKEVLDSVKIDGELQITPKGVFTPITIYNVTGCAEISLPDNIQEFESLKPCIDIGVQILEGKFANEKVIPCSVTALSRKQAKITSSFDFAVSTNIKFLYAGEEIFAKVIDPGKNAIIHFTKGKLKI